MRHAVLDPIPVSPCLSLFFLSLCLFHSLSLSHDRLLLLCWEVFWDNEFVATWAPIAGCTPVPQDPTVHLSSGPERYFVAHGLCIVNFEGVVIIRRDPDARSQRRKQPMEQVA